jgi:hypothetical protein
MGEDTMRTLFRYGLLLTLAWTAVAFATTARAQFPVDLAVTKSKDGPHYYLVVRNNGLTIPSGYKVIAVDAVPPGITITGILALGWVCAPALPVTGPTNVICTYNVILPIPTNRFLPSIRLDFAGASSKPNCVTVRLANQNNVGVPEPNMVNNRACK